MQNNIEFFPYNNFAAIQKWYVYIGVPKTINLELNSHKRLENFKKLAIVKKTHEIDAKNIEGGSILPSAGPQPITEKNTFPSQFNRKTTYFPTENQAFGLENSQTSSLFQLDT